MGLECFVESTDDGRALYESAGFVVVDSFFLNPQGGETNDEWKDIKKRNFPQPCKVWFMCRPKGNSIKRETESS